MDALIEAATDPGYPVEIVLVGSNRPDAPGLERAACRGIATYAVDHKAFGKDRGAFERALDAPLRRAKIEIVALAGFMRVLTPWFVNAWQGRLINIHPSLLPKYRGLDTHARALAAGDRQAGCTVHWVSAEVDQGEIIDQAAVPIEAGDTEATLAARVLAAEHRLYPMALAKAAGIILARA